MRTRSGKIHRRRAAAVVLLGAAVLAGCQSPSTTTSRVTVPPAATLESVGRIANPSYGGRGKAEAGQSPPSVDSQLSTFNSQRVSADRPVRSVEFDPLESRGAGKPLSRGLKPTLLRVGHESDVPVLIDDGTAQAPSGTITAAFQEDAKPRGGGVPPKVPPAPDAPPLPADSDAPTTTATKIAELGLTDVLAMAGAENWAILLANERIREAQANYDAAKVLWIPSLNAGVGYTKHDGQIQDTGGSVIDVSRNSLFVGGGAVTSDAPLPGAGGPARMFIDLSLADAIFLPRSTSNLLSARQWQRQVTFNDTLLEASAAYYEVVRAQQQFAVARDNLKLIENLLKATKTFEASGKGTKADVSRVEVQVERRGQDVIAADMALQIASAELARVLRINLQGATGGVAIYSRDPQLVPVDFIPPDAPLNNLTAQAVSSRPEINDLYYRSEAARQKMLAEQWRPWIPSLHAGVSAGGFGGGIGSRIDGLDGRADFDVLAVWQVRNLGFGVRAARDEASSLQRQTHLEYHRVRDIIIAQVVKAHAEVNAQKRRIILARQRVERALDAHKRSLARIRGFVGLPLEALQDVQAVIEARQELVNATVDYNRAQLKLLRAIGRTASQP